MIHLHRSGAILSVIHLHRWCSRSFVSERFRPSSWPEPVGRGWAVSSPAMIVLASTRTARGFRIGRFGALALVSVWLAHDAVFAAEHGFGAGFAAAMSAGGHDGYWWAFSLVVGFAASLLGLWVAIRLVRLAGRTSAAPRPIRPAAPRAAPRPVPTYRAELAGLWIALFAVTAAAFALQENVEHIAGHGHLIGLGALTGPEYPLALPVIAVVTFVAAALGAAGPLADRRPRGADRRPAPRATPAGAPSLPTAGGLGRDRLGSRPRLVPRPARRRPGAASDRLNRDQAGQPARIRCAGCHPGSRPSGPALPRQEITIHARSHRGAPGRASPIRAVIAAALASLLVLVARRHGARARGARGRRLRGRGRLRRRAGLRRPADRSRGHRQQGRQARLGARQDAQGGGHLRRCEA